MAGHGQLQFARGWAACDWYGTTNNAAAGMMFPSMLLAIAFIMTQLMRLSG